MNEPATKLAKQKEINDSKQDKSKDKYEAMLAMIT